MNLARILSLDAADPPTALGPPIARTPAKPPLGPPAIFDVSDTVRSVFGKFETKIEHAGGGPKADCAKAAKRLEYAKAYSAREKTLRELYEMDYSSIAAKVAVFNLDFFTQGYLCDFSSPKPRVLAVNESCSVAEWEDKLVTAPDDAMLFCGINERITRTA